MIIPRPPLHTDYLGGDERLFWACEDMVFGEVTVPANFLSDGLSIPRIFQNVFSKSPHFIYAGMLHDWTYKKDYTGSTRKQADKLFRRWMKIYGVGFLTRHTIYHAVRIGGRKSWKQSAARFYQGDHDGL